MKLGLLPRIVIAIVIGVVAGSFLPESRLLLTFNDLFSQFLGFFIPILIVGLVIPSIAEIGSGAGRMLALTALLAYGSTVVAGFVSYFTGGYLPSSYRQLHSFATYCPELHTHALFLGADTSAYGCDDSTCYRLYVWTRSGISEGRQITSGIV